jgi:hypothetical protein
MRPWRSVDAHNGRVETQNGAVAIRITLMRKWIRMRNKFKSRIRIRIKVAYQAESW